MAVAVRLRCSECSMVRDVDLKAEYKELNCPMCGRRLANLSETEVNEMAAVQKSQTICNVIAILLLAAAIFCMTKWVGDPEAWVSGSQVAEATTFFYAASGCALGCIIFAFLGARKRFVVEF